MDVAEAAPTIVLLLPALREQRLVEETLTYYATVDYPGRLIPVVVTSQKEEAELREQGQALSKLFAELPDHCTDQGLADRLRRSLPPYAAEAVITETLRVPANQPERRRETACATLLAQPTTQQLCAEVTTRLAERADTRHCHWIHYPYTTGRKASQLNYALDQLPSLGHASFDPEHTLVGVYDFDALPDPATFRSLGEYAARLRTAGQPLPRMWQQVQLPFQFRRSFAPGLDGLLMRGQVLYWLRRGLGIEVGRLLVRKALERGPLPRLVKSFARPMIYGIGSGMYFRLDAMREAGPFPEPHDDVAMGYRASFLGWEIEPVRNFNLTEPYYRTPDLVRAWASVCYGGTRVRQDLDLVAHRPSRLKRWEQWLLLVREWIDTCVWFAGPLVVLAASVVCAWAGQMLWVLAALLFAYPFTALALLSLLPRLDSHLGPGGRARWLRSGGPAALLVATFVAQPLVSAAGPWLLAARALTSRRGAELVTGKTER